jgi:PAS domain S-box-containing protein
VGSDADYLEMLSGENPVQSEMAVPVKIEEKTVAVINVESSKPDAYTSEDRKLVEILAENVASSIYRIDQLNVIRESEETYRTLLNASSELLALVTGTTISYLNDWAVKLLGYDSPNDLIGKDISTVLPAEILPLIRERALSRQRGEPQPNRYELMLLARNGRAVPVDASFSLISKHGKNMILVIARNMMEMNRYKRQVAALHRHASKLSEARSRDEVWNATLDTAESVVGFHIISILEPRGDNLVVTHSMGNISPDVILPLSGRGLTVKAFKEGKSILTADTGVDPLYIRGSADSRSELDVPVVVGSVSVAVINLESMDLNAFDEVDRELMETLALHVASALQSIS